MAVFLLVSLILPEVFGILFAMLANLCLTGAFHLDGLSDTADGIYSARTRERMLEIMKDSRVGANGVQAFVFFVLIKVALLLSLPAHPYAVLATMPILGRWLMSWSVTGFPYARPQGIGKAFAEYAPPHAMKIATVTALLPLAFTPVLLYGAMLLSAAFWGWWANSRLVRKLGGVTGDTYGAVTETGELVVLTMATVMGQYTWNMW